MCGVVFVQYVFVQLFATTQLQAGMLNSNMSPMPPHGGETMPGISLLAQQQLQQQQQGKP